MSRAARFGAGSVGRMALLLVVAGLVLAAVLLDVRLPRLLAAFGVGGLLAVAGVLLQALFRNPLADPFVLGVSGGAAIGALLVLLIGSALWLVQAAAAAGAILATLLVL